MEFHDRKEMRFTVSVVPNRILIHQDKPDRIVRIVDFFQQENKEYVYVVASCSSVESLLNCANIAERLLHFDVNNYLPTEKGQEKELGTIKNFLEPFRGALAEFVLWEKEKYAIRVLQSLLAERDMRCFAPLFMDLAKTLKACPRPDPDASQRVIEQFDKNLRFIVKHHFENIALMAKTLLGFTAIGVEIEESRKKRA